MSVHVFLNLKTLSLIILNNTIFDADTTRLANSIFKLDILAWYRSIAQNFYKSFGSMVLHMYRKFMSDTLLSVYNFAASKFHEIW